MTDRGKILSLVVAFLSCLAGCAADRRDLFPNSIPEISWDHPEEARVLIEDETLLFERREVIQSRLMRSEGEVGFTATVWRSGPGNRPLRHGGTEYANRCSCELLEDSRSLGPRGADASTIRLVGRGAWNHWAWHAISFSTSDGSDPRNNGRTYSLIRNQQTRVRSARMSYGINTPARFKIDAADGFGLLLKTAASDVIGCVTVEPLPEEEERS